ncbi:M48 family metallopeptidase [Pseudidiomarina terrestris]|uniref:M48 family metallopeptidase n=1 Tax=Pseudidiomarina terrestris TaxID=2820060 RepID=UPI0026515B10|nr:MULTISPECIES: SprT family zinc-dependent metalloprotease [unclassified Pseudidiomarina]MDN7126075.1 M48 family metallopeptidase [Pseudidiomarina sp. 1APR75-33.1]MDN7135840.1 M48 family metallopeptidase [Pseudidiomarina sp. 1ASP75-5]MDN7138219.1 M48 family metallopeptidase [Pseudidiomarina sp. 1ASP75-14]
MSLIYPIHRSKNRRSVAIKVRDGQVQIHAPWRLSAAKIQQFVASKEDWIQKHLQRQQQQLANLQPRLWQTGERLRWLGRPLELQIVTATRKNCDCEENALIATVTARSNPAKEPKGMIRAWYQQQAKAWLDDFFRDWPADHPLQPSSWEVGNFSSKWGHCSRKGELKFSWKLWLAPEWVVRNVVIHELCHLAEFNHSKSFWTLVARYSDDYEAAEQWLRQHGMTVLNEAYLDYPD